MKSPPPNTNSFLHVHYSFEKFPSPSGFYLVIYSLLHVYQFLTTFAPFLSYSLLLGY